MKLDVINTQGASTGKSIELPASVFGVEPNEHAVYLAVKQYNAAQRQGTHKAKEKGEITASTRKIKRQKGNMLRGSELLRTFNKRGDERLGIVPLSRDNSSSNDNDATTREASDHISLISSDIDSSPESAAIVEDSGYTLGDHAEYLCVKRDIAGNDYCDMGHLLIESNALQLIQWDIEQAVAAPTGIGDGATALIGRCSADGQQGG